MFNLQTNFSNNNITHTLYKIVWKDWQYLIEQGTNKLELHFLNVLIPAEYFDLKLFYSDHVKIGNIKNSRKQKK